MGLRQLLSESSDRCLVLCLVGSAPTQCIRDEIRLARLVPELRVDGLKQPKSYPPRLYPGQDLLIHEEGQGLMIGYHRDPSWTALQVMSPLDAAVCNCRQLPFISRVPLFC